MSQLTIKGKSFVKQLKDDSEHDVVLFINDGICNKFFNTNCSNTNKIHKAISEFAKVNKNLDKEPTVIPFPEHCSGKLVVTCTGTLDKDTDDSRRVYEAATKGMKKLLSLDCRKPLVVIGSMSSAPKDEAWSKRENLHLNVLLGMYYGCYNPLELREAFPERSLTKIDAFSVFSIDEQLLNVAYALEEGRRITRDIMGSDPERMAAPRIAEYIANEFAPFSDAIKISIAEIDPKQYPLMAAVNRAAQIVPRHAGRVVKMEYCGEGEAEYNLFLVGKGITYDTGGADIKAGGIMAGMHRDKGGAAAVAGFMMMLALLKPKKLAVHGKMAFVRNSVGEECYVADEIITARSGKRVRIGNTDAEGRMVMTDILCESKEEALAVKNPFLFTFATLTGHVIRAYGENYAAVMDNGPAKMKNVSVELRDAGDLLSDPAEISTIRREDVEFNRGKTELEDLLQCNNAASSATPRGHQIPAGFMIHASGLDKHGRDSDKPIPYTHIDVAGSAGFINTTPTASPALMMAARYILPNI